MTTSNRAQPVLVKACTIGSIQITEWITKVEAATNRISTDVLGKRKAEEITQSSYERHASFGTSAQDLPTKVHLTARERLMIYNQRKAAIDHTVVPGDLPTSAPIRVRAPVHLNVSTSTNQGRRPANEDVHVNFETPYGSIFAICDGHGDISHGRLTEGRPQVGQEMAELVAKSIKNELPICISDLDFDTAKAFQYWAQNIQNRLPKVRGGTTAVIGFFEKINHYLHVATIGDSEAVVFRKKDGSVYPIPMSTKINWLSAPCVERVWKIFTPEEFSQWEKLDTKQRRFPPVRGVNLANSLGDKMMSYKGQTAITHEPNCTLLQLQVGDLVLFACDGIFDFVKIDELIDKVIEPNWASNDLADKIANYALETKGSTDNVTAVTIKVEPKPAHDDLDSTPPTQPLDITQDITQVLSREEHE